MKRKVQAVTAALLLATIACRDAPEPDVAATNRFGSEYEIVTNENDALPDEPPALVGDTLFAHVAYPGGCTDHDFELVSEVRSDTARLWLRHQDHGDDCEAWISDRVEMLVSESVKQAPTILLMNPNASEPFVLRWGSIRTERDTSRGL